MDKSKSDKLKEVLNQTLTTEEIEKKLKNEIKQNAKKKIEQTNNNIETKIENKSEENVKKEEITSPLNKKVEIPNIREKRKETRNMNIVLYLVIVIALLLLGIVVYMFTNSDSIDKSPIKSIEKNIIDNDKTKTTVNSSGNEENKLQETESIETNKNQDELKPEGLSKDEKSETKVIVKEVIKEKIVTKTVKLDKKNFKQYYYSSNNNTLKCYDFKAGDIFPNKSCKSSLNKFLNENKDAIRIEIIPVIAQSDYIVFKKLDENIKSLDKSYQERVKEYMFRGLARERVLEITWQIRDVLGNDTVLTPTNYYVKSQKDNKGVIVKAYH